MGSVVRGRGRLLVVVAIVVAVVLAAYWYLSTTPDRLTDEYRVDAAPAARAIDTSMNRVYEGFDEYLDDSRLPAGKLKGVDDLDEIRRRFVPLYRNTDQALARAEKRIKEARKTIEKERTALLEVPSATLAAGSEEAEAIAADAKDYLKRADRFLTSFAAYADYARRDNELARRSTLTITDSGIEQARAPEEVRAAIEDQRNEFADIRRELERLRPHRDAEALHETNRDLTDVYVDYLDDAEQSLDDLDLLGLIRAEVQLLESNQRLSLKAQRQYLDFERNSGLQKATRGLTDRANELETAIAELRSEKAAEELKPWKRPKLPEPKNGKGAESEKRIS